MFWFKLSLKILALFVADAALVSLVDDKPFGPALTVGIALIGAILITYYDTRRSVKAGLI